MKKNDIKILCLLINNENACQWKQSRIADELKISPATVNDSLQRLEHVGLIKKSFTIKRIVDIYKSYEFLNICVPYMFCGNYDGFRDVAKETSLYLKKHLCIYSMQNLP